MLFLACRPLGVGFGRSSICLEVREEATASKAQSAGSCQRSLLPESARGFPVFLEVLLLSLRLRGQVQGLSPGLPPLQGSPLTVGWETQAEVCG